MRARTATRWLLGLFLFLTVSLALMSLGGDREASSILRQVVVGGALFGGSFYLSYRFKIAPRRAVFSDQARAVGLVPLAGDPGGILSSGFELVTRRASIRDIETTATGAWREHDVVVADYWYAPTSNTQIDDYVRVVCALFPVPSSWPRLLVIPERIATLVGDAMLDRDPGTESERFNRSFAIRTDDRRFASAVLDARMLEWILGLPRPVGFEILDARLLCFVPRQTDGDVLDALETGEGFLLQIPHAVEAWYR